MRSTRQKTKANQAAQNDIRLELRKRLEAFWSHPEIAKKQEDVPLKKVRRKTSLGEMGEAHLQPLLNELDKRRGKRLQLLGNLTTHDGKIISSVGVGPELPDDKHLVVMTIATTVTTGDSLTFNTHVVLFKAED